MNYMEVDGVRSDTIGLKFDKLPLWSKPARRTELYNVGTEQKAGYELDEYEDISITFTAYLIGSTTIDDVYTWLNGAKNVILSTQPAVYGIIRTVGEIKPAREGVEVHKIQIPITFEPFRYRVDDDETEIDNDSIIVNYGNIWSRPIWKLYNVQDTVFLEVNGEQIKLEFDGGETITIDTDRMLVYSGDEIVLNKTTGKLPLLQRGDNLIKWVGSIDRLTIRKRERWV